jgi:hypothetical protein
MTRLGFAMTPRAASSIEAGAAVDIDFITRRALVGRSFVGLASLPLSRSGTAYGFDGGILHGFASGTMRLGAEGLLVEPSATNRVTARKHNPSDLTGLTLAGDVAATLALADDPAALGAAGLGSLCSNGKVYRLDNSAGSAVATATFAGSTGSTAGHALSLWWRGTGSAALRLSGGSATAAALPGAYQRRTLAATPASTGAELVVEAAAGAVVSFILPQLELGGFATSEIAGATTGTATRPVETMLLAAGSAGLVASAGALFWRGRVIDSQPTVFARIVELGSADGQNRVGLVRGTDGKLQIVGFSGGAGQVASNIHSLADPRGLDVTFGITWGGGSARFRVGGDAVQTDATVTSPASVATLSLGTNAAGANPGVAWHRRVVGFNHRLGAAEFDAVLARIAG